MSKKLLKYGKFLLSMALIFCMVLPSYATLSATDGSSFVTKAEFDSALADFNSRLTSFEAGINSKIDSQVSTYLERNGIWQGKDQVIEWGATKTKTFPMWEVVNMTKSSTIANAQNTSATTYVSAANTISSFWPAGGYPYLGYRSSDVSSHVWMSWFNLNNSEPVTPTSSWCNASLLFTATKSGLAVVDVQQTQGDWRYWKLQLCNASWVNDHRGALDLGYAIVANAFKEDGTTVNPNYEVKCRTSFANIVWTEYEYAATAPSYNYQYFSNTSVGYNVLDLGIVQIKRFEYFFVKEGDKVYIAMSPVLSKSGDEAVRIVTWNTTAVQSDPFPLTMKCQSAVIY